MSAKANKIQPSTISKSTDPASSKPFMTGSLLVSSLPTSYKRASILNKKQIQYYKALRSGSLNIIFGNKYQDSKTTRDIVSESHGFWKDLIDGKEKPGKISISQTSQPRLCKSYIPSKDTTKTFDLPKKSDIKPAEPRPAKYDKWFYLDKNFQPLPEQEIDVD